MNFSVVLEWVLRNSLLIDGDFLQYNHKPNLSKSRNDSKIDANEYIPPNFSAMVMAALDL